MIVEQKKTQPVIEMKLFGERMYVELPEGTVVMPEDMVQQLYPYEKRPQYIYYQRREDCYFTFSLLEKSLTDKQVGEAIFASFQTIEAAYPKSIIEHVNLVKIASERQCGWFSFQSPSLGMPRYNVMYVTSIDNQFMHGTCSCFLEDEKSKSRIKQVPLSIQMIRKGRGR